MAAAEVTAADRHPRVLLDTSVVIDYPAHEVAQRADTASISSISLAELAFGLHTNDPVVNAAREQRYHWILATFDPISFDADCARTYGALCAQVRTPVETRDRAVSTCSSQRSPSHTTFRY